ncbi:Aldo/keto reductase [Obba rivulosa]|uniref:Aldo/keto reductase n=1 Tax=Obba rivulosa TaxID=1052685 RepID=A0A8E2AZY6_9APHY|nr:Aldo/keto reductase [Obba rivulosa]
MSAIPKFKLNTGASIPAIGLGGWGGMEDEERAASVQWMVPALKTGYRHIDTAWHYGTEKAVSQAVKESGIPREEIWITTKLPLHHHSRVQESFQESLDNLGMDYVDLYLLHWPQPIAYDPSDPWGKATPKAVDKPTFNDIWAEIEKIYESGKAKAIGVSNFSIKNLEKLLTTAKVVPAVNQVELHPYLAQPELKAYCDAKGILLTAYAPTGYKNVLTNPLIVELAEKYKVSSAQIVLAWHLARGVVAVPKSSNPQRQKDNITLPTLEEEDVKKISSLDRGERLCNKPDENGMVFGWSAEQLGW